MINNYVTITNFIQSHLFSRYTFHITSIHKILIDSFYPFFYCVDKCRLSSLYKEKLTGIKSGLNPRYYVYFKISVCNQLSVIVLE